MLALSVAAIWYAVTSQLHSSLLIFGVVNIISIAVSRDYNDIKDCPLTCKSKCSYQQYHKTCEN